VTCGPLSATSTWYTITGIPQHGTSAGSPYNVGFTDPDGITYSYQLVVNPCALTFTTNYLPPAKEGVAYYAVLGVSGGQPPYTWTATGLPPGMTLSPNGVLSGTPMVGSGGNYSFTVTVTDTCCTATGYQGIGSLTVAYGTYDIMVSIDSSLKIGTTQVSIDSAPKAIMAGGQSQKFEGRLGTSHIVTLTSPVSDPQNSDIRYSVENANQTVSQAMPSAYFTFFPEYRITLNSDPAGIGSLSGSNWYARDKTFTASAPAVVDSTGQQGTRYEFKEWLLPNGTTSVNKDLSFVVSGPGSCTARYNTLYALTLVSKYGNETSWHIANSLANWSVASPKQKMSGIMGVFGGTETALNPSGTANMSAPQEIQINYESNVALPISLMLLLAIVVLGGGGWAVYRFAIKPSQVAPLPSGRAARRLPEEVIEVQGVVDDETKITPGRRAAKSLPPATVKRLPAGRGATTSVKSTKKPATGKKSTKTSRTQQTKRRSTRRR